MRIKAGTLADFAGSMAEAMELALKTEWVAAKGSPLPEWGQEERRLLLASIAQGVVKHLKERAADTFQVAVDTTQVAGGAGEPLILSDNPLVVNSSSGFGQFNPGDVQVQQTAGANNMVKSRGTGTVSILTVEDP